MKRSKKMLLLLLALVVCIGGYWGVGLLNTDTDTVNEEKGTFALESHTAEELTSLSWTQNDETLSFTQTNGTWTVTSNAAFPLAQDDVQAMADTLLGLTGTRQLDGVTDLTAYGLDEESFAVTATWSDGTQTTYTMGDETPFGDGYYFSMGQSGIVYTVEDDITDVFDTTLDALAVLESIPSVANATRLTVGATLDIVKEDASRTINESELWYDSDTGAALDVKSAEALIADAQAIAWDALVNATSSDAQIAEYGLDDASATTITLYTGETVAMTMLIGAQDDNGDYYARLPGSTMIYTVESADVADLLSADTTTMPSMVIIDVASENVKSVEWTAGEVSYCWQTATLAEEASDVTEEEGDTTETATTETDTVGEGLWQSMLALSAEKRLTDAAEGSVLMTVQITTTDDVSVTMNFTEYDADTYAVSILDRVYLTDAATVDGIIRTLRANAK